MDGCVESCSARIDETEHPQPTVVDGISEQEEDDVAMAPVSNSWSIVQTHQPRTFLPAARMPTLPSPISVARALGIGYQDGKAIPPSAGAIVCFVKCGSYPMHSLPTGDSGHGSSLSNTAKMAGRVLGFSGDPMKYRCQESQYAVLKDIGTPTREALQQNLWLLVKVPHAGVNRADALMIHSLDPSAENKPFLSTHGSHVCHVAGYDHLAYAGTFKDGTVDAKWNICVLDRTDNICLIRHEGKVQVHGLLSVIPGEHKHSDTPVVTDTFNHADRMAPEEALWYILVVGHADDIVQRTNPSQSTQESGEGWTSV